MKRFLLTFLGCLASLPLLAANVTSVSASVTPATFKGSCPKMFEFSGVIAVDGPVVVRYKWIRSDGATAPEQSIRFRKAGRQVVKTTWTLGDAAKLPNYSGWESVQIVSPGTLASNRASFTLECAQKLAIAPHPAVTGPAAVHPKVPGGAVTAIQCIDPAAFDVSFAVVRRDTQFRGRVRITGTVKNIGTAAFTCNPGTQQASAHLYELPPGATSGGTLRAHTDFSSLAVNGTVTVTYERDWDSSSPSEGEFPPSYKLMIVYDPDIRLDGNPANDDCHMNNNDKSRSGTEINALFH